MNFLPARRERYDPGGDRGWWLPLLFASAAATALATRWPWTEVWHQRLWGTHLGPPGWHTTAGFTCLCSSVLVAVMAIAETRTPGSRQAVRPGSAMLMWLATAMLAVEAFGGPGDIRGVSAMRTTWFWIACCSVPVLLAICTARVRTTGARR